MNKFVAFLIFHRHSFTPVYRDACRFKSNSLVNYVCRPDYTLFNRIGHNVKDFALKIAGKNRSLDGNVFAL